MFIAKLKKKRKSEKDEYVSTIKVVHDLMIYTCLRKIAAFTMSTDNIPLFCNFHISCAVVFCTVNVSCSSSNTDQ